MIEGIKVIKTAILNRLAILKTFTQQLWSGKNFSDKTSNYYSTSPAISTTCPETDVATNFYLRVCLEGGYDRAIEIGAYNGRRAVKLKSLLPNIEVYGLDVMYRNGFENKGVIFRNLSELENIAKNSKSVLLSRGTISYMSPNEVDDLLKTLKNCRTDIALREPVTVFNSKITRKRSCISYYHPYSYLLKKHGFDVKSIRGKRVSLSMGEVYNSIFAKSNMS